MSDYTQFDRHSHQLPSQTTDSVESSDLAIALPLPTDIVISLAMLPLLAALVSSQAAIRTLSELGSSSEELFRGSRLPTLPLLT
ncbi:MAG: hypothetical protein WA949_08635 [Phormidesmis sp.]